MSGYVKVNRLSLVQLHAEERKQRAHLKKIADMQRRGGIDNNRPAYFPHVKNNFVHQQYSRNMEISRQNYATSQRLIEIMQSKGFHPVTSSSSGPSFHPMGNNTSANYHSPSLVSSQNNSVSPERTSKVKGLYDVYEWQKSYEEHKQHLKISKNNKLFTPRDVGVNRERIKKVTSVVNSRRPTITESTDDKTFALKFKN